MEFRMACEGDRRQVEGLWAYCFEPQEHPFFRWYFERWQPRNTLCSFEANHLAACVHLNPYNLRLGERTLPASYIVGLATAPEARRGGVAGQLLRAALVEMRRRKRYFNILMPSKAGFYYPYGWELCYHQIRYQLSLEDLRGLTSSEGTFQIITDPDDWRKLASVYNQFTTHRHGYVVRCEDDWRRLLESHWAERGYAAMLVQDEQPTGYLLYHIRDGAIIIGDMAYSSYQGHRSLLGYLYNHRSQATSVELSSPLDDTLHLALPNPKQGVSIYPFMAGRIVDVARALESMLYLPGEQGQLKVAVSDPLANWNHGTFAITVQDGQARVEISHTEVPDISCDIGALSLLVFGRLSAKELVTTGRIAVRDEASIDMLNRWFPKCDNYINEYF